MPMHEDIQRSVGSGGKYIRAVLVMDARDWKCLATGILSRRGYDWLIADAYRVEELETRTVSRAPRWLPRFVRRLFAAERRFLVGRVHVELSRWEYADGTRYPAMPSWVRDPHALHPFPSEELLHMEVREATL